MVTLQILVLSFLVRIQVAQLKRLSFEGRFFCCMHMCRDGWHTSVLVAVDYLAPMQALYKSPTTPQPRLSTHHHTTVSP